MTLRAFEHYSPMIAASAYVDDTALVIGQVQIEADSSIWPQCVVRGDVQQIYIGKRTSIQDGTIIHVTHDSRFCPGGQPTWIGDEVTVGHLALLHACTIEDQCLIGMGAIVMDKAVLHSQTMIGAGSLVPPGKVLEGGYLYVGRPVVRVRPLTTPEIEFLSYTASQYVQLQQRHRHRRG